MLISRNDVSGLGGERLLDHPYAKVGPQAEAIASLVLRSRNMEGVVRQIMAIQQEKRVVVAAEDMSARPLGLIAHNFMRLAHAGGHIETVPPAVFIASGRLGWRSGLAGGNRRLQRRLDQRAGQIVQRCNPDGERPFDVALITDRIESGISAGRIVLAFQAHGVRVRPLDAQTISIRGAARQDLGVERLPLRPTAFRSLDTTPERMAALRGFLDTYATSLYETVFNEPAPVNALPGRPQITLAGVEA